MRTMLCVHSEAGDRRHELGLAKNEERSFTRFAGSG
jgi:hypothetical protein